MNNFLQLQFTRPQQNPAGQVFGGLLWAVGALALKMALGPLTGETSPFLTFFPAVMGAGLLLGGLAGPTCLALTTLAAAGLTFGRSLGVLPPVQAATTLTIYFATGATMVWLSGQLRSALVQLSASREQEVLMIGELQHRVKNTLAIVQAIAAQTLRTEASPAELRRQLTERLVTLGEAHNLLSETGWREVSLRALVERTVVPFVGSQSAQLSIAADRDVLLPPAQVVNIALCLHELATNATKYGAWTVRDGRVRVGWSVRPGWRQADPPRARLEWSEDGGPTVVKPSVAGFGSRLLRQSLAGRARSPATIEFAPSGLRWSAEVDLAGMPSPSR